MPLKSGKMSKNDHLFNLRIVISDLQKKVEILEKEKLQLTSELDKANKLVIRYMNRNNELWIAGSGLKGGLEKFRGVHTMGL